MGELSLSSLVVTAMFSWIAGESCKASCVGADPTTDTVKFVAPDVTAEKEEEERRQQEQQQQLRLEAERKRAEEAERQRVEQARLEQERKEREERECAEREELARQQEQERLRLLEEQRRQAEESARAEAEAREKEEKAARERARREEEAAQQQLQAWLQKNNYASVNTKKSKMMSARYPLHDAVAQKDATAVRLLLRFGADATLKNSLGKTAQDVARNTKGCEDVVAAFSSQTRLKVGGA